AAQSHSGMLWPDLSSHQKHAIMLSRSRGQSRNVGVSVSAAPSVPVFSMILAANGRVVNYGNSRIPTPDDAQSAYHGNALAGPEWQKRERVNEGERLPLNVPVQVANFNELRPEFSLALPDLILKFPTDALSKLDHDGLAPPAGGVAVFAQHNLDPRREVFWVAMDDSGDGD